MKKEIITTLNAPAPIGPYNQAVKTGNTLYISGQIPLKASSMELLNGTIKEETQLVMENLQSILEAAGMTFENVVKSSIFIDEQKILVKLIKFMVHILIMILRLQEKQ